jgi:UDP-glucose 4-epimerase
MSEIYLVTGIAGFIGSKLAERLLADGHKVIGIDNLSTGFVDAVPEGAIFIKGDCQDQKLIDSLYNFKFDAIFHIAGQSSGEISFDDPVYDLQTNTQSTLQLLKFCHETGCKKFIYASSMSVYGDVEDIAIDESVEPKPKSFYGVGKLASEHYLRIYSEQFGISTTALRLFNVYGPGQNLTNLRQGMVSIFLAQALKQGALHVKGAAERFRDFVFIDDVVESFLCARDAEKTGSFVLCNICSGVKTTVGDVVQLISDSFDEEIPIAFEGSTPGDQFGIYGNPALANSAINWKAKKNFTEGMEMMDAWAKNIMNR